MAVVLMPRRAAKKQIPAHIGFQATVGDNTLHLRSQTAGFDCTIDWGDGSKTNAPTNGGNVVHNYASAGLYDIKISGKSFAGFYVNDQAGKEKYVAAYSMGKWEVDTLIDCMHCFNGCSKLIAISKNLFKHNTQIKDFNNCFNYCESLTSLPVDLFRYNVSATDFSYCFYQCNKLETIPPDLFKYNTAAINFNFAVSYCYNLALRSDIFGNDYANRFNGKTVNFSYCFARGSFTGTQGTAPELWNFTGLAGTHAGCFALGGNSTASLTNYSSIPTDWK